MNAMLQKLLFPLILLLLPSTGDVINFVAAAGAGAFLSSSSSSGLLQKQSSLPAFTFSQKGIHHPTVPLQHYPNKNLHSPVLVARSSNGVSLNAFWNKNDSSNNKNENKPKTKTTSSSKMNKQIITNEISQARKKQLGIVDEREYDLDLALERNTDPLITKIIAGSFILVVIGLLVAGIIVPSVTDYGEGVCNPIRTAGRC
jgi:hypothetical protein